MHKVDEKACAKINLDLRVCGRRADGYHELDSLVVFAEAGDRLVFEPADELALTIGGPFGAALAGKRDNLVISAAKALAEHIGREANARITLDKRLPIASGLGGGSADAAATLRGLSRLWNIPLGLADLGSLALTLGADVPVCLGSTTVRMQGIGDRLTPVAWPSPSPMVLVNSGDALSTPEIFQQLQRFSGARDPSCLERGRRELQLHLANSVNDLEAPAIRTAPAIGVVLDALRCQTGCTVARMSGSGATCFGLFDDINLRDRAAETLAAGHADWWVLSTEIR